MIKIFRIVAFLEGISYLGLLGIGVPLKYITGDDSIVKMLGMPHGMLFLGYLVLAYLVKSDMQWNTKQFIQVLLASIIPFGTFWVERKLIPVATKK